jgi:hypothetical protein
VASDDEPVDTQRIGETGDADGPVEQRSTTLRR